MTYLRYPHISNDLIAFVADDDVWLVGSDGGRAWRLTADHAPVRQPRLSPDATHVAFVSHRDGHPELMLADVTTGAVRRLTWWGGSVTTVLGWASNDSILVASNAGEANMRHAVVKAVSLDGSFERLRYGTASGLAIRSDGALALSTPGSRPPAWWKRYRGGTAPRLWFDASGTGSWTQLLPDEHAGLVDPMWVDDKLLFVSDRAARFPDRAHEQANLWVWDAPGDGEPRQLTFQTEDDGYVRDAATDGTRVIWHSRGQIRMLDDIDAEPRTVEVRLPGTGSGPVSLDPKKNVTALSPDHGGDASLVCWRGKTFWLAHREGPARAIAAASGVRTREPVVLGKTGSVAYVTDADGEDAIEVRRADASAEGRRLLTGTLGRVLHLAADPEGTRLAAISHDGAVRLIDVEKGTARDVGRSLAGEALSPTFSPDGRYLAWSQPTAGESELHQIRVLDTTTNNDSAALTTGKYHDHSPAFTRDGKHIVFLSDRTFDPHYNQHAFDLAFSGATRPWLIPLSATEPAPFGPSSEGWHLSAGGPEASNPEAKDAAALTCPDLDAEGAEERITPFPVPSADYRDVVAAKDGVLWIRVASDEQGELGSRRAGVAGDKTPDRVERWSFPDRTLITVADEADHFAVSGDGERIVVQHKDDVTVLPATRKTDDDDSARISVDMSRLRFQLDTSAEWRQMFDENSRIMRDHYWREDMNGVDWDAVTERWRSVVDAVRTHDDLVDVLWETVGELNTSHAYVTPTNPLGDASRKLGFLGADLSAAAEGWCIDRILPGESSEPAARSPLRQAGVGAREGDIIVAVNGAAVDPVVGPAAHLIGAADKPVELTLRRPGGDDRRVVVIPLGDEETLRYQDWVRSRRDYVAERSGGRIGYLHVPDMVSSGWAQLNRDLRVATEAEAVIADVRYNRGGHTSQLVIERLASRVVGWAWARQYAKPIPDPDRAPRGPVVLVANENSGSDGDIVNARAQALGVGPVIGVRTWGGVVGIDGRFELVDGTGITQPRYATWLEGKDWSVENHGVDPDIEVVHTPSQLFEADDPQLDRAIDEALTRLERTPAATAPPLPEPRVRR
ncbi:S41 family peptidase [Paramicrobacterium chengjingii]|uniref:Tricorn protease homolog n=1 Tax=Paramicrobacterium chengjingii TaxID=2769067 RepID=A0ABX6YMS3_9MICO|nr:S41 family peptidase [Microbacterium chengjingii]QPZ40102.1 PDZ domain-containing protein [Microbacterium chengjingii]